MRDLCPSVRPSVRHTMLWTGSHNILVFRTKIIMAIYWRGVSRDSQRRRRMQARYEKSRFWTNIAYLKNSTRYGLLWTVNRNSYAIYRMVSFSVTLSDPEWHEAHRALSLQQLSFLSCVKRYRRDDTSRRTQWTSCSWFPRLSGAPWRIRCEIYDMIFDSHDAYTG